jgi:hypothetical protein
MAFRTRVRFPDLPRGIVTTVPGVMAGWLVTALFLQPAAGQPGSRELVSLTVGQRQVEGRLLAADSQTVVLLRREGSMNFIPRERVVAIEPTGRAFTPQTADRLRASLQAEFGSGYSVSQTGHFVVVHPPGDSQQWASPFEDLFLRFGHYFSSRGFAVGGGSAQLARGV